MADLLLVIGTRRYSSWSLRPWLALKAAGLAFAETEIALRRPDTKARILDHSPSGQVPLLRHGDLKIWDSLAICEYVAELAPAAGLWPEDRAARAVARAVGAEMHAGFRALRQAMPMDVPSETPMADVPSEVATDIARITELWNDCRARFGVGGPFLFGRFSIADAMYAPVVTRFTTYGVATDSVCRSYIDAVQALPAMREWYRRAA